MSHGEPTDEQTEHAWDFIENLTNVVSQESYDQKHHRLSYRRGPEISKELEDKTAYASHQKANTNRGQEAVNKGP